jgi:hypothetical protein
MATLNVTSNGTVAKYEYWIVEDKNILIGEDNAKKYRHNPFEGPRLTS